MASRDWRIGVAGLGTIGAGLLGFIAERPDFAPAGGAVRVGGVSARSRHRPRPYDIAGLPWFDDPVALATSADIDIFVELIGGSDGPAKAAVEAALDAGKPVITANKALIAVHGLDLARRAEIAGVPLLFEAAVMGGTPAVKLVREALGRRRHRQHRRHPQRNLQLHPYRDGGRRPRLRRRARRGPAPGLRRGRPDHGRRRLRRRPQDHPAVGPGLRRRP